MSLNGYLIVTRMMYGIFALCNIGKILKKEDPGINLFALFIFL